MMKCDDSGLEPKLPVGNQLGNQSWSWTQQRIEQIQEEIDCAHMVLNDQRVPHGGSGKSPYSLAGRIYQLMIQNNIKIRIPNTSCCGNPRHPLGPWHSATPLPHSCNWLERFRQWTRRKRWGCGCAPDHDHEVDP
jgi:hypothetical protein